MSGLVSGLQNRVRRFESARNLQNRTMVSWMSGLVSGLQNHVRRFESARDLIKKQNGTTKLYYLFRVMEFFYKHLVNHVLLDTFGSVLPVSTREI